MFWAICVWTSNVAIAGRSGKTTPPILDCPKTVGKFSYQKIDIYNPISRAKISFFWKLKAKIEVLNIDNLLCWHFAVSVRKFSFLPAYFSTYDAAARFMPPTQSVSRLHVDLGLHSLSLDWCIHIHFVRWRHVHTVILWCRRSVRVVANVLQLRVDACVTHGGS